MTILVKTISDILTTFGIPTVTAKPITDFFTYFFGFFEAIKKSLQAFYDFLMALQNFQF